MNTFLNLICKNVMPPNIIINSLILFVGISFFKMTSLKNKDSYSTSMTKYPLLYVPEKDQMVSSIISGNFLLIFQVLII